MGFGHRVYKTDDPRSLLLRSVSEHLGGPLVEFSQAVERTTVDVLAAPPVASEVAPVASHAAAAAPRGARAVEALRAAQKGFWRRL